MGSGFAVSALTNVPLLVLASSVGTVVHTDQSSRALPRVRLHLRFRHFTLSGMIYFRVPATSTNHVSAINDLRCRQKSEAISVHRHPHLQPFVTSSASVIDLPPRLAPHPPTLSRLFTFYWTLILLRFADFLA